jgi:thioredoxin-like negative regulator of GroEL
LCFHIEISFGKEETGENKMSLNTQNEESFLPSHEELLQMGIRAAQSGNNDGARMAFEQILSQDRRNERAMMWMAKIADSKTERKKWLDRVLNINPDHAAAREALKQMAYVRSARENRLLQIVGMIIGVGIVLAVVLVIFLTMPR